jgi:hypothetical protein
MFIKEIKKKDRKSVKQYTYYRLVAGYRVGNKTRHQNIINMGTLEGLDREHHKALANRIEELIMGKGNRLFIDEQEDKLIEAFAQEFSKKIINEKLLVPSRSNKGSLSKEIERNYQEVDMSSIELVESKSIGSEWLSKQAFDKLNIGKTLEEIGMSEAQQDVAQMLLTAKLVHPSSELESESWLAENSAIHDLYKTKDKVSRYKLYQAASIMYENKEYIETELYKNISDLFSGRSKIVIYDLTNMHFEGRMLQSNKAKRGRSKQKQKGSPLISLALSIDSLGFVRSNKFYKGNISEPGTFKTMLKEVSSQFDQQDKTPVVVMDAGIATEENLKHIREKYNYDYVCVSTVLPKEYEKLSADAQVITDNRDHKIELTKISVEGKPDHFLHVKSDEKEKKENSIDEKLSKRLEKELQEIKDKLPKKRTLKKIEKIHEKVGKIKAKLQKVGWLYDIEYTEDKEKGIVTDITWQRIKERERPKGVYFLRYTQESVTEQDIWQVYNLTREVEAVFRLLKTDLHIRPIHHQKDKYIEPHLWLGIMAYQVVNYIRRKLKENEIHYSWTTIREKMTTMQSSLVSVNNSKNETVFAKLCTRPTKDQVHIFDALNFKHRPFVRKTKVVPQMQKTKT